jgi:hypothetical protein
MNAYFVLNLAILAVMQLLAQVAMKYGSGGVSGLLSRRWWLGFVLANAVGAPSMLFARQLYRAMPGSPNLVAAVALAGTFTACQLGLAVIFRIRLSALQGAGIVILAAGSALAVWGQ